MSSLFLLTFFSSSLSTPSLALYNHSLSGMPDKAAWDLSRAESNRGEIPLRCLVLVMAEVRMLTPRAVLILSGSTPYLPSYATFREQISLPSPIVQWATKINEWVLHNIWRTIVKLVYIMIVLCFKN